MAQAQHAEPGGDEGAASAQPEGGLRTVPGGEVEEGGNQRRPARLAEIADDAR